MFVSLNFLQINWNDNSFTKQNLEKALL